MRISLYWHATNLITRFSIHRIAYDNYTGWMAFADLFGTFFGLYLLHAFVMLVVGFVIPNDAKSLGGGDRAYPNM